MVSVSQTALCHNLEDSNIHSYRCENLKPYFEKFVCDSNLNVSLRFEGYRKTQGSGEVCPLE
jgi:hypothetical protein